LVAKQRNLDFLKSIVNKIWKVLVGAEKFAQSLFAQLKDSRFPDLPENLTFLHAEEILDMYPDLPRKQRETKILQKCPAVFIIGIGWSLKDAYQSLMPYFAVSKHSIPFERVHFPLDKAQQNDIKHRLP